MKAQGMLNKNFTFTTNVTIAVINKINLDSSQNSSLQQEKLI